MIIIIIVVPFRFPCREQSCNLRFRQCEQRLPREYFHQCWSLNCQWRSSWFQHRRQTAMASIVPFDLWALLSQWSSFSPCVQLRFAPTEHSIPPLNSLSRRPIPWNFRQALITDSLKWHPLRIRLGSSTGPLLSHWRKSQQPLLRIPHLKQQRLPQPLVAPLEMVSAWPELFVPLPLHHRLRHPLIPPFKQLFWLVVWL